MAPRRKKNRVAQPKSMQSRPPISCRIKRPVLDKLDAFAARLDVTRNDLMEGIMVLYMKDRGEDIEALFAQPDDETQGELDIFA